MKKIFSMHMQKRLLLSKAGLLLHQIVVPRTQPRVTTTTSLVWLYLRYWK